MMMIISIGVMEKTNFSFANLHTLSSADINAGSSLNVSLIRPENFLWILSNSSTYCCGP